MPGFAPSSGRAVALWELLQASHPASGQHAAPWADFPPMSSQILPGRRQATGRGWCTPPPPSRTKGFSSTCQ